MIEPNYQKVVSIGTKARSEALAASLRALITAYQEMALGTDQSNSSGIWYKQETFDTSASKKLILKRYLSLLIFKLK